MKIFLTGATGFIGSHILCALNERKHIVTCLVRKSSKGKVLAQAATQQQDIQSVIKVVEGEWAEPATWLEHIAGHDAVINAIGVIRESQSGEFDAVHTDAPMALFDEAAARGSRIVQISALGADDMAATRFHLSKREADTHLSQQNVPYLIIRPSFVYGSGGSSMPFFAWLASLPITPVPGDGQYKVQPIHIDDLVRAVVGFIERDDSQSAIVDAGGGEVMTFDRMLEVLGEQLGKRTRHLHIPWTIMSLLGKTTDLLGGRGPITSEEISMLKRGNFAENTKFVEFFGFQPVSFSQGITRSGIQ